MKLSAIVIIPLTALFLMPTLTSAQSQYEMRLPYESFATETQAEILGITLSPAALPAASQNTPYSFDFKSLTSFTGENPPALSDVQYAVTGSLPSGLTLGANGVLSGEAVTEGTSNFEVIGSYQDASGQQIYTINVAGVEINITSLSLGGLHSCAITESSGLKCWGRNNFGQLGNGGGADSQIPVDVFGLTSGVTQITLGGNHTCARLQDTSVKCWGANTYGSLGNSSTTMSAVPVTPTGLDGNVTYIAAGGNHTCAVNISGAAFCWGRNDNGQLGDDSTNQKNIPTPVFGMAGGVSKLSLGLAHSCALITQGGAKCWGRNSEGQLGDNSTSQRPKPVGVSGLNFEVNMVQAGGYHSCALKTDGSLLCWGAGGAGQLGNGSTSNRVSPTQVSSLTSGVTDVSLSGSHTCSITSDRGALCWGQNNLGQLGDGTNTNRPLPTEVFGMGVGVSKIATGNGHSCLLMSDGNLKCWGYNNYGALGNGSTVTSAQPVDVVWE